MAALLGAGEALALRPFLSATDADLLPRGIIELETGASFQRQSRSGADRFSFNATNFVFNFGVSDRLQLAMAAGPDLFFSDLPHRAQPGLTAFSEASLTTKVRLLEGDEVRPGLATEWTVTFPAEAEAGFQSSALIGTLAASDKLGPLTYHLNLGGAIEPRLGEGKGAQGALLWATSGQVPLSDGVDMVGELRGRIGQAALPNATALMGLVWKGPGGIKFDLAAFVGLGRGPDDWGIVGGLTYELLAFPWGDSRGILER